MRNNKNLVHYNPVQIISRGDHVISRAPIKCLLAQARTQRQLTQRANKTTQDDMHPVAGDSLAALAKNKRLIIHLTYHYARLST